MTAGALFETDPNDTETALMAATYRALCSHGYADLTIQKIGNEFEKSPSLLYHHYDGKDELLLEFLDSMLSKYEDVIRFEDGDDHWQQLRCVLTHQLGSPLGAEHRDFVQAMIELRAQAVHDEAFRSAFTRHDEFLHDKLESIVREGIEAGSFDPVDPEAIAALVQTTIHGALVQRLTGTVPADSLKLELLAILDSRLRSSDRK